MVVASVLMYILLADVLIKIVSSTFARDETLTGRTDIWRAVLDAASHNPLLGVGYGGFWGLDNMITSRYGVNQSHNGYLGVYLELGIAGIILLSAFILAFCDRIKREFNHSFEWGLFGISFLMMLLLYNYSESAFLTTGYLWSTTVFVMIVFSTSRPGIPGGQEKLNVPNKS
jgi:O-antigen ligase